MFFCSSVCLKEYYKGDVLLINATVVRMTGNYFTARLLPRHPRLWRWSVMQVKINRVISNWF